jgi:hypothetical protein
MKSNMLAVLVICAMAGAAVSCRTAAPHTMLGPVDYPQARKGGQVQWSSSDGNDYDIRFTNTENPPCQEGALLHIKNGVRATCHVVGKGLLYTYVVGPPGFATLKETAASTYAHRAFIVPCHACSDLDIKLKRPSARATNVGAVIALGWSNSTGGSTVVLSQCSSPSSSPNDACAYQGQTVEWELDGDGTQLQVTFAPTTPCVDGGGQPVYSFPGSTSTSPISLPLACTIGQNATKQSYPYTFKVDNTPVDNGSTLTVKTQ